MFLIIAPAVNIFIHNFLLMNTTACSRSSLTQYLLITCLLGVILYFGKTLFIPLSYGLFIAIVFYPFCKWLEHKDWPRSLAITVSLVLVIVLMIILLALLLLEMNSFRNELPALSNKIKSLVFHIQSWLPEHWNISVELQKSWWVNALNKMAASSGSIIWGTFAATGNMLFTLLMSLVFAALFLYHRGAFVKFLELTVGQSNAGSLRLILNETVNTYFRFIKGMTFVYLIVGVLNSIGLLMLGIPHAILFGMLTAIMTIIPYAGIFISALLPIAVAWISKDSLLYPLGVVAVFTLVQYLEANIIFPRVVGAQLNISTWATLVAIIAGGLLWGVSGMILFIPFVGVLKILTSHLNGYEAINALLSR